MSNPITSRLFSRNLRKTYPAAVKGVLTNPAQGCVDGIRGGHILLAPPFIISAKESDMMARALRTALQTEFA